VDDREEDDTQYGKELIAHEIPSDMLKIDELEHF